MDVKLFFTVFVTIFLAEIGDKTQLATFLYASGPHHNALTVFFGAAAALVVASGIGVLVGTGFSHMIDTRYLSWIAGTGFILIGIWTLVKA